MKETPRLSDGSRDVISLRAASCPDNKKLPIPEMGKQHNSIDNSQFPSKQASVPLHNSIGRIFSVKAYWV